MRNRITAALAPKLWLPYSSAYYGHWKCAQAPESGAVIDSSGNGRHLALGASLTDDGSGVWGDVPGYLSLPGKLDDDADGLDFSAIGSGYPVFDWNEIGLIVLVTVEQAAAEQTSSADIMGNGGSSLAAGWRIQLSSGGNLQFRFSDGSNTAFNSLAGDIDDGNPHKVVMAYDGPTETVSTWVDTVSAGAAADISGGGDILNAAYEHASWSDFFSLGTTANAIAADASPLRYRDVHIIHTLNGLPASMTDIVSRYSLYPFVQIPGALLR